MSWVLDSQRLERDSKSGPRLCVIPDHITLEIFESLYVGGVVILEGHLYYTFHCIQRR